MGFCGGDNDEDEPDGWVESQERIIELTDCLDRMRRLLKAHSLFSGPLPASTVLSLIEIADRALEPKETAQ